MKKPEKKSPSLDAPLAIAEATKSPWVESWTNPMFQTVVLEPADSASDALTLTFVGHPE